jgi:hypothetical protein
VPTPEHPFWVRDKGWTAAGEIEPGEELRSHDGQWIPLDSKHLTDNIVTVYNMRVAENHTYFVGSPLCGFTVWAHNTNKYTPNGIDLSNHAKNDSLKRHGFKPPYNDIDNVVASALWQKRQTDGAIAHICRQPNRKKLDSLVIVNPNTKCTCDCDAKSRRSCTQEPCFSLRIQSAMANLPQTVVYWFIVKWRNRPLD